MPLPVRSLSVLQNWDCQGCTLCCRQYHVPVSPAERARIEKQGWEKEPGFAGVPLFVRSGGWFSSEYRLNHQADGACVFLGPDNRCRIHAKLGAEAKPLACRNYPFTLVPGGDHWKLGVRFTCPSAAASQGRPLSEHLAEARVYAAELEQESATGAVKVPAPALQGKQRVPWSDVNRIVAEVSDLLAPDESSVERRWRKVLFLIDLMRKTTVGRERDPKKVITGGRLGELLEILSQAAEAETPESPDAVPPPGSSARMVFRLLAAFSTRQDKGPDRGTAQATTVGRLGTAIRFVRGRGLVPRTHAAIERVTFDQAEAPLGAISSDATALLTRWARVKIESGQFCGPTNFDFPVWDGLESLALTFATAMWLARVLAAGGRPVDESVSLAVRIVDDNFGFNPFLARRQRIGLGVLTRGELTRLVAWYGR